MAMLFGMLGRGFSRLGAAGKGKFSAGNAIVVSHPTFFIYGF